MSVYAVLGAGAGGQALAATLTHAGHEVRLWNRSEATLDAIRARRRIAVEGAVAVEACPAVLSSDIADVVRGADVVFVVVPAHAHLALAEALAALVTPSQAVVLNPGRTGGALGFAVTLERNGCGALPAIAETQSLLYTCRLREPGSVDLLAVKKVNVMACLPAHMGATVVGQLSPIYAGVTLRDSTLDTGLENMGAILHPAPVLLNTGWIESRDKFFSHYYHGISKSIACLLERMDEERLAIADAFDISVRSLKQWHEDVYGCIGDTLFETLRLNSSYASIDAPYGLNHRYIFEDVPTGLVPLSELAKVVKVSTPLIDLIISLANQMTNTDFRRDGRNLHVLGLEGKAVAETKRSFRGQI